MISNDDTATTVFRCLDEACVFHLPIVLCPSDPLSHELDDAWGTSAWPDHCPACGGELVRYERDDTEKRRCVAT